MGVWRRQGVLWGAVLLARGTAGASYTVLGSGTVDLSASNEYHRRVFAPAGSGTVQARLWQVGLAERVTWDAVGTTTLTAAGRFGMFFAGGTGTVNTNSSGYRVTNFHVLTEPTRPDGVLATALSHQRKFRGHDTYLGE